MILTYLIFAHLLGDFVFQPAKLVAWKMQEKKGVLVHVLIHFILNFVIFLPFLMNGYEELIGLFIAIGFCHFWIDQAKINYDLRHDKKVRPFIIDQLLHFLTILVGYFFIVGNEYALPTTDFYFYYQDLRVWIFLSTLIFLSTILEIYRYQKNREKDKQAKFQINYKHIAKRMGIFTAIYAFFMFLSFYADHIF